MYSLSIVFDEPPAPAARDEFGFCTVLPVALRLEWMASKRQRDEMSSKHSLAGCRDVERKGDAPGLSTGWLSYSRRRRRLAIHGWG